ncbi:YHYH domain-containing protein [Acinetobacter sp. PK01]
MNKIVFFSLLILTVTNVNAHSGGTNSQGCHTNSKTGDHHCH